MKNINCYNSSIEDVKRNLSSGISKVIGYEKGSGKVEFVCKNGSIVIFYHEQDCCESVWLEDSDGLINKTDIFTDCNWCEVEEVVAYGNPLDKDDESCTWTFYKFKTNKGYDTLRWYGTSNGYYSEGVDFEIWEN